jgi:hypothetical protein
MLIKSELDEYFYYKDGNLFWKKLTGKKGFIGKKAGSLQKNGYIAIRFKGKLLYAHRMIFVMFNNYEPNLVDHVDCNKQNNNIENLRECSALENSLNKSKNKNCTFLPKGIKFRKQTKKYQGRVMLHGKEYLTSCFTTVQDAQNELIKLRNNIHGNFANHG